MYKHLKTYREHVKHIHKPNIEPIQQQIKTYTKTCKKTT